jgi:uncharacterized protein (TIGR00288 family)
MTERQNDTKSMALFCDFENVALGVRDSRYQQFDISKVLERLLLKGSIVVKKAYCDWERYREFKAAMHQASFELIEIPHLRMSGKNSADIRLVVDALDLCYTKSHVDTFVIISGDSDFSPLVSKLRENAKTVIGVGVKNSTSELLINNCDEFIYYDDLVRVAKPARRRVAAVVAPAVPVALPAVVAPVEEGAPADRPVRKRRGSRQPAEVAASVIEAVAGAAPAAPARLVGESSATGLVPLPEATSPESVALEASPAAAALEPSPAAAAPAPTPAPRRRRAAARPALALAEPLADSAVVPLLEQPAKESPVVSASAAESAADQGEEPRDQQSLDRMQQALDLVVSTIEALAAERGEDEKIWGSMVKQTLKRRKPGFNESYYGFRSFNRLLEEARERGLIELDLDDKSGGYTVRSLA